MIARSMSKLSIAKMVVALVAFCGLLWSLELQHIYQTAQEIDPFLIGCVFVLALVGVAIQTEKWHLLLSCCYPGLGRADALFSLLVGFSFGMFTPGRIGELGRGAVLKGDVAEIALFTAVDRLASMCVTLLVGSGALLWIWTKNAWQALGGAWVLLLALALTAWALANMANRFGKWAKFRLALARVSMRVWLSLGLWSLLFNVVFLGQFYLLVGGIYGWSLEVALAVPALFALKSMLPVSFLDIGVREGIAVWLYSYLGFDPLPAFNASLLVFSFNVLLPGVAGWLFWGRRDTDRVLERGWRKVLT